jgi:DNA processing protein
MPNIGSDALATLRLTLTPGLGPRLIARLIAAAGSPAAALDASPTALRRVPGIGQEKSRTIHAGLAASADLANRELDLADRLSVHLVTRADPEYPALLAEIPDAPPLLYVQGSLDPADADRFAVGIVGSRSCTPYGLEQTARFATAFAHAGLTVVSGGARGIDTAAHAAALRASTPARPCRTVAVLGCGLAHRYPPENAPLFDAIVADAGARGAIISELPLDTPPVSENFPARNRLIAGLSLGVLVIEAGRRSGALITAHDAADQGREVFALPARVDSSASEGSLELLKAGAAQIVTHPEDVIRSLESQARHHHAGTHAARFAAAGDPDADLADTEPLLRMVTPAATPEAGAEPPMSTLTPAQASIVAALDSPRSIEDLGRMLGLDAGQLRAEVTVLELRRRLKRRGSLLERA